MQRPCQTVFSYGFRLKFALPLAPLEPDHGGPQSVDDDQQQDGEDEDDDHKDGADGRPDDKSLDQETGRGSHHAADQ